MHAIPLLTISWSAEEGLFRALNLAGTNAVVDVLMYAFTTIGLVYILALLVIPLWWRGKRDAAVDLLVLLGITMLVTEAIKFLTDRPRPCEVLTDVRLLSYYGCGAEFDPAFPSGHTSRAFAVAAFLLFRTSWRPGVSMLLFAALIGLSRIYLGVHWPSDVIAGAGLGFVLGVLFVQIEPHVRAYGRMRALVVRKIRAGLARLRKT